MYIIGKHELDVQVLGTTLKVTIRYTIDIEGKAHTSKAVSRAEIVWSHDPVPLLGTAIVHLYLDFVEL